MGKKAKKRKHQQKRRGSIERRSRNCACSKAMRIWKSWSILNVLRFYLPLETLKASTYELPSCSQKHNKNIRVHDDESRAKRVERRMKNIFPSNFPLASRSWCCLFISFTYQFHFMLAIKPHYPCFSEDTFRFSLTLSLFVPLCRRLSLHTHCFPFRRKFM